MMAGSIPINEFPDVDPKFEAISYIGTLVDLTKTTGKEHERWLTKETQMLTDMAMTARGY